MGGAATGGGHAQHKTGGGHGDGGDAGMLGEVSGANTDTSTCQHNIQDYATFLVSSNFIHTCLLSSPAVVFWSHFPHVLKPSHVQTHPLHCK